MFLLRINFFLLLLPSSFAFTVSTTPSQHDTLDLSPTPSSSVPANASSLTAPRFHVDCDGDTYGYHPNIRDCEQAKEDWAPDAKVWTLGQRRTGLPSDTVPLPYRVMGPRGLCYIQPTLIGDHRTGQASINMIRRAAAGIILQCIATAGSRGGIATGIGKENNSWELSHFCIPLVDTFFIPGGDNNVAVAMGPYTKPVFCGARLRFWEQCREIVFSMPADTSPQVFGPRDDPTVTRGLPIRISSGSFVRSFVFGNSPLPPTIHLF